MTTLMPQAETKRRVPRISMRSLTIKLTVAFLVMGLFGALLVSISVRQVTQRAFDRFVADRDYPALADRLSQYYASTGSWDGVSVVFATNRGPTNDARRPEPILVDSENVVRVGDTQYLTGTQLVAADMRRRIPIITGTTVVGWLIEPPTNRRPIDGSPETDFMQRVSEAITYSAVAATAFALLLGIVLARTLTRPLRELTTATQHVARGVLGQQVVVRSRDELGALAVSFNQMSADLAQASTLRRQMTADIAHDLRTPLSVILGYTEALRDGKLPPEQDIFDTLHIEAQHLQHLINDLRTLSLADAGELPLTRQTISPHTLLDRIAATYRAQAQAQGIALETVYDADDAHISIDVERMAQVLGNLIANALRFTPRGGTITLGADTASDNVRVRVNDTGLGIAAQDIPHIFERFFRGDVARQQSEGSSGLGLAIAKGIVEAHGGTIEAESQVGKGTTFMITLPRAHTLPVPEFA